MAVVTSESHLLLLLLCILSIGNAIVSATVFTVQNHCSYTVWLGTLSGNSIALGEGGFALAPGGSVQLQVPAGRSGRLWGRTDCSFDEYGAGTCVTGDCPGRLKRTGAGHPPMTLVEFTVAAPNAGGMDFYDVSLVEGYNAGMAVRAIGGTGNCQHSGCLSDINVVCPEELQVTDGSGQVVGCKSACGAFNTPRYCCTGRYGTPQTCGPTWYSQLFKSACPTAYSYAYDDATSVCTCTGADYLITFCPSKTSETKGSERNQIRKGGAEAT